MQSLAADIRFALRNLARNRGFSAACLVTLVLGIVLNTAVFSVVNAIFFRPLPFRADKQVVILRSVNEQKGLYEGVSYPVFRELDARRGIFQGVAVLSDRNFNLSGSGAGQASAERVRGGVISANALDVLGITPLLGRGFSPEDEAAGAPVALITEGLWRNRFAADPSIIGRSVKLDGAQTTIVGVLPYKFRFVFGGYRVLTPLPTGILRSARDDRSLQAVARLAPGVSLSQAQQDMSRLGAELAKTYPETDAGWSPAVSDYRRTLYRDAAAMYVTLLAAACLVLLIVCANVSNLFLAKAFARQKEVAIRLALGANRWRVIRETLTEGMLVAGAGGGLALAAAYCVRRIVVASVPELAPIEVDIRVFAYTWLISLFAGLAFGLGPALAVSKPDVNEALKSCARGSSTGRGHRLRTALVVSELALGLMLLAGTGLLVKTMANVRSLDPGYRLDNLLTAEISLEGRKYADTQSRERYWNELTARLEASPGITAAAVASGGPLAALGYPQQVELEGRAPQPGGDYMRLLSTVAGPRYREVLGLRLLHGRDFHSTDRAGTPPVAVVNETFARHVCGPGPQVCLGKRVRIANKGEWLTVIGVVSDARQTLTEEPYAEVLTPYAQSPTPVMSLIIRTSAPAVAIAPSIRGIVRGIDQDLPMSGPFTSDDLIENYYPRVMLVGLGALAGIATVLATVGLYGVMSFLVERRRQEIGVRAALGAGRARILRLILGQSLRLAVVGAALGLAGAWALSRVLAEFLFGVSPADPAIFGAVTAVLVLVSLAAGTVPALKAARVDPAVSLRYE